MTCVSMSNTINVSGTPSNHKMIGTAELLRFAFRTITVPERNLFRADGGGAIGALIESTSLRTRSAAGLPTGCA
jgi:hypothetical protein